MGGGSLVPRYLHHQELFETTSRRPSTTTKWIYHAWWSRLAAPDELIDSPNYQVSRVFAERARRAGYSVEKVPMPIDWDCVLAELRG